VAWTSPMTFSSGAVLTAAQLNTYLRDNSNETAPAKATGAGGLIVTTAANAIVQRTPTSATVATSQTTTSTSYGDLATAGPSVTVTTGAQAIVFVTASMSNNVAANTTRADFVVSGATTRAASDATALINESGTANEGFRGSAVTFVSLTAGSNTIKEQYRVTGVTTGTINDRHLVVLPL
jgi:hypothetical protein